MRGLSVRESAISAISTAWAVVDGHVPRKASLRGLVAGRPVRQVERERRDGHEECQGRQGQRRYGEAGSSLHQLGEPTPPLQAAPGSGVCGPCWKALTNCSRAGSSGALELYLVTPGGGDYRGGEVRIRADEHVAVARRYFPELDPTCSCGRLSR